MKRPLRLKNSFPLRASELKDFITGNAEHFNPVSRQTIKGFFIEKKQKGNGEKTSTS